MQLPSDMATQNGCAKSCYPARQRTCSASELPPVVQVEVSFRKLNVQTSQTTVVRNYDGSEVTRTITHHKDGIETIAETKKETDGRIHIRETVKNLTSGKSSEYISLFINSVTTAGSVLCIVHTRVCCDQGWSDWRCHITFNCGPNIILICQYLTNGV